MSSSTELSGRRVGEQGVLQSSWSSVDDDWCVELRPATLLELLTLALSPTRYLPAVAGSSWEEIAVRGRRRQCRSTRHDGALAIDSGRRSLTTVQVGNVFQFSLFKCYSRFPVCEIAIGNVAWSSDVKVFATDDFR